MTSVAQMLDSMLAQTRDKLAAAQPHQPGSAASEGTKIASAAAAEPNSAHEDLDPEKVAAACDFLAVNLANIVDDRTNAEKVAEHIALDQALKVASAGSMVSTMPQSRAEPSSQASEGRTPQDPTGGLPLAAASAEGKLLNATGDSGGSKKQPKYSGPVDGQGNMETNAGDPPGSGSAPDKNEPHSEKSASVDGRLMQLGAGALGAKGALNAFAKNGPNALRAAGGAALIVPAAAGAAAGYAAGKSSTKTAAAQQTARQLAAQMENGTLSPKQAAALLAKGGVDPVGMAKEAAFEKAVQAAMASGNMTHKQASALLRMKMAAPSDNPVPNPGSVTGEETEGRVGKGDDPGRELISSNESAINFTKGQAKAGQKKDVGQYLDEPALSAASDPVLQKTLDNASAAGVKIAGELQKWASASPENAARLRQAMSMVQSKTAAAKVNADPDKAKTAAAYGLSPAEMTDAEQVFAQLQAGGLLGDSPAGE